jgi:hypothetical protein
MSQSVTRDKVMEEIQLIPEHKLEEVYDFVHYFRIGLREAVRGNREEIMKFAGCWNELPEEDFQEFSREISERRAQAFSRRRSA